MSRPIVVGDTVPFKFSPRKGGVPWDLTGAVVTFYLQPPGDVALITRNASVAGGEAYYTAPVGEIAAAGEGWERSWRVVQNGEQRTMPAVRFTVLPSLPDGG
jgi:hypothetical protein